MAGNPRKRQLHAELAKRTTDLWPDDLNKSSLDYVCAWIEDGQTLRALADSLSVSVAYLQECLRAVYGVPQVKDAIAQARETAAHTLADDAVGIADRATKEDAQVARLQVNTRQWLAEKYNAGFYGQKAGMTVNVSIGDLMLAALQMPAPGTLPAVDVIDGVIEEDAQLVSIDEPMTSDDK